MYWRLDSSPPNTPKEAVKIIQDAMTKMFKDPEFHKDYLKLVGEEPTPVMPDEMEKLVKELPRVQRSSRCLKKSTRRDRCRRRSSRVKVGVVFYRPVAES